MTGIEHPRYDSLSILSTGTNPSDLTRQASKWAVAPDAICSGDGTPNQHWLGDANARVAARRNLLPITTAQADVRCVALLATQEKYGHMAIGNVGKPGQSVDEFMACSPHGELHGGWATVLLNEAVNHGAAFRDKIIAWWAVHLQIVQLFWTPAGPRLPCARALSLPPAFGWDAWCYGLIVPGKTNLNLKKMYGNISPGAQPIFQLLTRCASAFKEIRDRMATTPIVLSTPVRLWRKSDGSLTAALVHNSALIYDQCGFVVTDTAGHVTDSGRDVAASFAVPADQQPQVVGIQGLVK